METGYKILIGDTRKDFGVLCRKALTARGFAVTLVPEDGLEILAAILKEKPDLVILPMALRQLDAGGVFHVFESLPGRPAFIITSAVCCPELERRASGLLNFAFLLEPYPLSELYDRIDAFFGLDLPKAGKRCPAGKGDHLLEMRVSRYLYEAGIPRNTKGFAYLLEGSLMALEEPELLNAVTTRLYPFIAFRHHTTAAGVEKAIRSGIRRAGLEAEGKPLSNSAFLADVVQAVSLFLWEEEAQEK